MAQASFYFPLLEVKDIIHYLREVIHNDFDLTENDFRDPQKERWQKFYTLMLCNCCMDLTPDCLNQMPINSALEYPELYEDSMGLFNLVRSMQTVLTVCCVEDFNMSDVLQPKAKRLVKICSAVINFLRFQEERIQVYNDLRNENEALQDQRDSLLKENEEFQMKINDIKSQRAEQEPEVLTLQNSIGELQITIADLHKTCDSKHKEASEFKTNMAEKKAYLARIKEQLTAARHENTNLSSQIVPSPDRLKGEMQRMERQLHQGKLKKEEAQQRLRELRKRHQQQQKRDYQCDQALKLAEASKEQIDQERATLRELSKQKDEASACQDEIKRLDAKLQQVELRMSIEQEQMEKWTMLRNSKMKEMKSTLEHLRKEKKDQMQVCSANKDARYRLYQEKERVAEETRQEVARHRLLMDSMKDEYQEMLGQLEKYHVRLGEASQKLIAGMSDSHELT